MSLEISQVGEIFVHLAGKARRTWGTGYLVRDGYVLTAEHVCAGQVVSIELKFMADQDSEWTAEAEVAWSDRGLDIAVLRVIRSADSHGTVPTVPSVPFGVITRPTAECEAAGFPAYKVRDDRARVLADGKSSKFGEYEYVTGPASRWQGLRGGTLALSVKPPGPSHDPKHSPWEGMSGAAVFCGDYVVGVVREHHADEGPGTLTASAVDHWYEELPETRLTELAALIGLPSRSDLSSSPSRNNKQIPPEIVAAATKSYLQWMANENSQLTVTALASSGGAMKIDLERVYVGLKVDFSSQAEREAARLNRWRELIGDLDVPDLLPGGEVESSWQLANEAWIADYFGLAGGRMPSQIADEVLTIGELYRRSNVSLILGDPGSGKTTIMRWLALHHAKALIDDERVVRVRRSAIDVYAADGSAQVDLGPSLLPILVRVAEYATDRKDRPRGTRPRTLLEFLGHHSWNNRSPTWQETAYGYHKGVPIPSEILAEIFHAALREHRALVVLDGLDEVPREERVLVADEVTGFINTWVGDRPGRASTKLIATSRIAGYRDAPLTADDLTQVTIQPMTDEALEVFLRNRVTEVLAGLVRQQRVAADPLAAEQATGRLLGLLYEEQNRYVRGLATNPLLAGTIVSVFIDGGQSLPRQRVELYQSAVSTLTKVWGERLSGTHNRDVSRLIIRALPAVAAYIHETKPAEVISSHEFREKLLAEVKRLSLEPAASGQAAVQPAVLSDAVNLLLEVMEVELGLLVASGPDSFRFAHRSFQEYLSAQHLIEDPGQSAGRILEKLGDPRWREPILMAIGLLNWQHKAKLAGLVESLLAQEGPLARFFPETALLLAAAIPQMAAVPPHVVRRTAQRLLTSYGELFCERRMPKVRELLEAAVAALRATEYAGEVDTVLTTALREPADGPVAACAAARLIRDIEAASTELAAALAYAATLWDMSDLGSPIAEELGLLVSPPTLPENETPQPRLVATAWGDLTMRDLLRTESEMVATIRCSPRWLSLLLTVYGGCWNLGTATALDEYERMSSYLRLDETARAEFAVFIGNRSGREEPALIMLVWNKDPDLAKVVLNEEPELAMVMRNRDRRRELKRRFAAAPRFDIEAMTRDSPALTAEIVDAVERDLLAELTVFLRESLGSEDVEPKSDALLALWALGEPVDESLADQSPAATRAARRVAGLIPGLADATVRAATLATAALANAARQLPAAEWELLGAALTKILHHVGADPVSLFGELDRMPEQVQTRVLTEEIAQRVSGWGDDPLDDAKRFSAAAERYPVRTLLEALCAQGSTWSSGYRRYAHWWPCDRLAFPPDADDEIPVAVLDQLTRLPADMEPFFTWHIEDLLPQVFQDPPTLAAIEPGLVMSAHVRGGGTESHLEFLGRVDDYWAEQSLSPAELYHQAGCELADPWIAARLLLRVAEQFTQGRAAVMRDAEDAAGQVFDPVRAFQLHERLALVGPADDRTRHVAKCRDLAMSIQDPAQGARALLRVTRLVPSAEIDDFVSAAADRLRRLDSRAGQLELLRVGFEMFPDRPVCQTVISGLLTEIGASGQERAHVMGRWGDAVTAHLPVLCGDDETLVQAFVPVSLYARAIDYVRAGRQDQLTDAWHALRTGPSPDTVQRVLHEYTDPFIQCTGSVARSIDEALTAGGAECLHPILARLVRVDFDAEPTVRTWLGHPAPGVRQVAGLLLAERDGMTVDSAASIIELLLAEDDLLRARARKCVIPGPTVMQMSVTTMGQPVVTQLAGFANKHRASAPGMALVFRWHLERLLQDDPQALSAWCDAVDLDGPQAPEVFIVAGIRWITTPVWKLLLDRLRSGSPALQASILRAVSNLVQECANSDGDFDATTGILRINQARWTQLYEVLGAIDPEPLLAGRLLPVVIDDVFETVDKELEARGGVLSAASGLRASQELRRMFETSFGAILAASTEAEVRQGLYRLGRSTATEPHAAEQAVIAVRNRRQRPDADGRPWTGLLTEWVRYLLSRRVRDSADLMERDVVLQALAAAAEVEPESFRDRADQKILSGSLAEVGLHHDSWPGRAAAARLLGVLRYGSPVVFRALQQMLRDTSVDVRKAAHQAILQLRSVDLGLINDLGGALSGQSVTVAWAAAQLLGEIGENIRTPKTARDAIIAALAAAVEDPRSRRAVHFAFADTALPEMPELDDVCTETLRRVYRLG